jgi:hypothetical protein
VSLSDLGNPPGSEISQSWRRSSMKKLKFFFMVTLLGFGICNFFPRISSQAGSLQQLGASSGSSDQPILKSTLQILVYPQEGELRERGFGTLITLADEPMVLTHDHWDYLHELDKVQILNTENKLLVELSASEFTDLIRYSDRGTLIFAAPDLPGLVPARISQTYHLSAGDRITVVHRDSSGQKRPSFLSAQVHSVDTYNGLPVIRFISPDEEMIRQGDSGGGVWYQGELVANTWGMYVQEQAGFLSAGQTTQTSIAALVPGGYLDLIAQNQEASQSGAQSAIPDDLEKMAP